jgi:hypothetical protein
LFVMKFSNRFPFRTSAGLPLFFSTYSPMSFGRKVDTQNKKWRNIELIFKLISQNFREVIHIFSPFIYIFNIKLYSTVSAKKRTQAS